VFYFCQFLGADVSAHGAFLPCSVQCHLFSIFCTFVIEQINDDDDDDDDDHIGINDIPTSFCSTPSASRLAWPPQSTTTRDALSPRPRRPPVSTPD